MLRGIRQWWHRVRTGEIVREGDRGLYWFGGPSYEYREGDYSTTLSTELLVRPINLVIYAGCLRRWAPPHSDEEISDNKRAQIARMLESYLTARKMTVEIDWEPPQSTEEAREQAHREGRYSPRGEYF